MEPMHLEVEHPVIQHKLSILRSVDTGHKEFRELVGEITMLLAYEALKHVELAAYDVETPLAHTTGHRVDHDMVIVPVLRAGVGMLNSLLALLPTAKIGFVGLFRDHETKQPVEYYSKLPPATDKAIVFLVDPMLATGGSTNAAIDLIRRHGFAQVVILSIVAAPEGMAAVESAHPEVNIYSAAIDDRLDENKYIVPGLGDAGDRLFGTH
jgi:uracil phosphoribosyltransferase